MPRFVKVGFCSYADDPEKKVFRTIYATDDDFHPEDPAWVQKWGHQHTQADPSVCLREGINPRVVVIEWVDPTDNRAAQFLQGG